MVASSLSKQVGRGSALVLALSAALAFAAEPKQPELKYEADDIGIDLPNDALKLNGNVRVMQGAMSIDAEQATATDFRSDNSRWSFERSVRIRTSDAELKANSASATFVSGQIARARIQGGPAEFEQHSPQQDRQIRGRARIIDYDFAKGTVKLTDDVWFSYGEDEFRTESAIYYLREERIQLNPDGAPASRVKGTIRPPSRNGQQPGSKPQESPAGSKPKGSA